MVHHYEYSTINSHHKVLVNLQASNIDALKNQNSKLWPYMLAHTIRFAKLERIFNKLRAMWCLNCCLATKITAITVV